MISLRIGLLPAVLTLGLTACGQSISPFPGFNSGIAQQDYHQIMLNASAGGLETYDRGGRLVAVSGPLVDREDLPMEIFSSSDEPIELAARLDTLPIPLIRPAIDPKMDYGVVEETKPNIAVLTEPTLAAIAAAATLQETASVTPIPAPTPRIDDLLVQRSEAVVLPSATLRALEPTVRTVAFQPDTGTADPAAGLALLDATRQTESTALLPGDAPTGLSGALNDLTVTVPDETTGPQAGAPETGLESEILSMTDEEIDILLVQLESEKSGLDRVRSMTPEDKARLRHQYEKRSFLGHFARMDRSNDGALTREEMLAYFSIMHAAFDADYDDVVTRDEAPTLLLRIKLLGRGFPAEGLTLKELSDRLDETFDFLDRNNNNKLGWPELL